MFLVSEVGEVLRDELVDSAQRYLLVGRRLDCQRYQGYIREGWLLLLEWTVPRGLQLQLQLLYLQLGVCLSLMELLLLLLLLIKVLLLLLLVASA